MNLEAPQPHSSEKPKRASPKPKLPKFDLSDVEPVSAAPKKAAKKKPGDFSEMHAKLAENREWREKTAAAKKRIADQEEAEKETPQVLEMLQDLAAEKRAKLSPAEEQEVAADLAKMKASVMPEEPVELSEADMLDVEEAPKDSPPPVDERHRKTAIIDIRNLERREADEMAVLRAELTATGKELKAAEKAAKMPQKEAKAIRKEEASKAKPFEKLSGEERMKLSPDELLAMAEESQPDAATAFTLALRDSHDKLREKLRQAKAQKLAAESFTSQEEGFYAEGDAMSAENEKPLPVEGREPGTAESFRDWVEEMGIEDLNLDGYMSLVKEQERIDREFDDHESGRSKMGWLKRQSLKLRLWALNREVESFSKQVDSELGARAEERRKSGKSPVTMTDIRRQVAREFRRQGRGGDGHTASPLSTRF